MPVVSMPDVRRVSGALVLGGAVLLQGCATGPLERDPIEPWNRQVFSFNEAVDRTVLQPVARGYNAVVPSPVRTGVRNFMGNIGDAWSTVNLFLQGRFADGTLGVIRVSVNTTFGLLGVLDVATPMQLERQNEDLGQTFGVWGMRPGPYVVWPFLGSSTARDSVALPGDLYASPSSLGETAAQGLAITGLRLVSVRANILEATNLLDDVALDKYSFVRDAYLQRRQNLIYEGNPPESNLDDDESDEDDDVLYAPSEPEAPASEPAPQAPAAAAAPASGASGASGATR
ncbi:VacJ family lipoprotein [uncultured Aquabacterium sp.]|jgi:phospholipid-binding lipoprotein MlaA|uniref:MlaA family lipoprotein n=1 Tax=uncultured Aquabacterium sp. TaxID=158753 RepID=UPI002613F4C0|nr:VacJ family lipoprotein [uncultured Aquabacterium sp.]